MVAPQPGNVKPSKDKLRAFRAELTELIPWVTVLKKPRKDCDGLTHKYWKLGFKTRREMTDEERNAYRCSKQGLFRFRALKSEMRGKGGTYCEIHLRTLGIFSSMGEEARYIKWASNNTEIINRVRIKYGLEPMPTVEEVERERRRQASRQSA